jgi:hypothetical protein
MTQIQDMDALLQALAGEPAPEPTNDLPSDSQLASELAPFTTDPQAIRWHVARRLFELSEIAARQGGKTHDSKANRDYVALTERLAKVLGLDAPKEVQLEVSRREPTNVREMTTSELEALVRQSIPGEATRVQD